MLLLSLLGLVLTLMAGWIRPETRVIKGYECPPHSQPWQVALFLKSRLHCGASLIDPRWLVTAAHCRKPRYQARLGVHNIQQHEGTEQVRLATRSFPHPGFNSSYPNKDHRNDIMLVKLDMPAYLTAAIQPIALPQACVSADTCCLISGWGTITSPQIHLPATLRCANIRIIPHKDCEASYPGNVTSTMVCASVRDKGRDSCQGDSGGPLVCNGTLQGIISWGQNPCATTSKPGVYTRVCKYVDWIRQTMRDN